MFDFLSFAAWKRKILDYVPISSRLLFLIFGRNGLRQIHSYGCCERRCNGAVVKDADDGEGDDDDDNEEEEVDVFTSTVIPVQYKHIWSVALGELGQVGRTW